MQSVLVAFTFHSCKHGPCTGGSPGWLLPAKERDCSRAKCLLKTLAPPRLRMAFSEWILGFGGWGILGDWGHFEGALSASHWGSCRLFHRLSQQLTDL